jgi:hypothetical protein
VKKVKVDQTYLTIEGTRALHFFSNTGSAATFPEDRKHPAEKLLVTIVFEQPLSSMMTHPPPQPHFRLYSGRHPQYGTHVLAIPVGETIGVEGGHE